MGRNLPPRKSAAALGWRALAFAGLIR